MKHIYFAGDWQPCAALMEQLQIQGTLISLLPPDFQPAGDLLVVRLSSPQAADLLREREIPWVAWIDLSDPALATQAYSAGAQAVFPENTPQEVLLAFVQRFLEAHNPSLPLEPLEKAIQRRYQKGDTILLSENSILEVQEGVIAQTMVHQDGSEVLLGLFGPHTLVVPHPADTCYIQLIAHTNATLLIQPWSTAVLDPRFTSKLRSRLQQMEAWAAMQARPHLDQRVLGILSLLAEQFGVECERGELIQVRITHTQLASAVGATRSTITRTLGDLKLQERLFTLDTEDGERYCLPRWEPGHHGLPCSAGYPAEVVSGT
jgi:CRP-like cAMP-binding protein